MMPPKDVQRFFYYFKFLDRTNAAILEGLAEHGPRNLSVLAKSLGLPITTVRFRLNKMVKDGLLLINANLNMPKLGLIKGFLAAEAHIGHHEKLLKAILNTDYWTYIIRCYGKMDGYCAYFAFPFTHKTELQKYWEKAAQMKIFPNHRFLWVTNSEVNPPIFSWYDFERKEWRFRWKKWIDEILKCSDGLPQALKDPKDYSVMADKTDLLILKELEKNGAAGLKELTKVVNITPQSIGNRYKKHIIQRNLIINYNIDVYPYPPQLSDLYTFIIDFKNGKALVKFVNASNKKPFMVSSSKVLNENSLIANMYILKTEFPNLIESLNRLYSKGLIKDLFYVTLDPTSYRRQTISYEYFKNGKWTYNLEEKIKQLKDISRTS
ncbi:MAG: winged helix-turn-helix transcriptional regulator [Candidatus Bathyarchaeota archaeon]|nr:winged helix-turn-helix transcriptional regulator [Candidatus Bathyarchaeota archaeon]MDH5787465.1 winged helix-turn-helix transcriptional regulator [Candidatus Bathyarchaeota archaeon]